MIESWFKGCAYLLSDDLVSYYSYFTAIFAEIAFLWGFGVEDAMIYTILLLGCIVNVLLTAWFKGSWFCEKEGKQRSVGISYCVIYLILLVAGCVINVKTAFILFVVPLTWTGFSIWLRGYQNSACGPGFSKREYVMYVISKIIRNPIILFISEVLILLTPVGLVAYFVAHLEMALIWKILLPVLTVIFAPLWAYIEDSWATQNIFELAYEMD